MDQLRKKRDNEVDKQKVKVTCKEESETKSESYICKKVKDKVKVKEIFKKEKRTK